MMRLPGTVETYSKWISHNVTESAFNEISKTAIQRILDNKHRINMNSVESQRRRQLLDLMIGFKLSPLLWRHIQTSQKGLSAGRVQSTLLRYYKTTKPRSNNMNPIFL